MRLPILLPAVLLLTVPATAGETDWQDIAPGVKMRLISTGQVKAEGKTLVALEIDMPETTKTYWRVPGDTGMPTEFDFAGSEGVDGHTMVWPYPTRDEKPDYLDYAYFGPTVLPIEVTTGGDAPVAELSVVLGVCSDICIPAQAHFSLPLTDAEPDRANGLRIRQAVAMAPMPWDGTVPFTDIAYDAEQRQLAVRIAAPEVDAASLIASTPGGEPVFGTPQKSPEPDLVLIPILGKADDFDLAGQDIQLTFLTDMGAFEVTQRISDAASD
jgi:DsbC/DsbD-like thiol-disulfide interchange protein